MVCNNCGGLVGRDDLFCPRCGAPTHVANATGPVGTVAPAPRAGRLGVATPIWVLIVVIAVVAGGVAGVLVARGGSSAPIAASGSSTPPSSSPLPSSAAVSPTTAETTPTTVPTLSLAQVYTQQQSGVVRIETLGCGDSQGVGTGFLLSPTLIATVDHVVADSTVISLIDGSQHATGEVIGHDPIRDLALVRSSQPLQGFEFRFSSIPPRVGDQVAAIGFPIGDPITLTQGNVSGLGRSVNVDGSERTGLLETDAAVNPGNSGGPLMEPDGTVVGLVDALNTEANGIAYAVPVDQAAPAMSSWTSAPTSVPSAQCGNPSGPSQDTSTVGTIPGLPSDIGSSVAYTLNTYFNAINSSDYVTAVSTFSLDRQAKISVSSLAAGDATSIDYDQQVISAHLAGDGSARVALSFVSLQDAAHSPEHSGDTCDVWTLVYRMTPASDGSWRIDDTNPYRGQSYSSC